MPAPAAAQTAPNRNRTAAPRPAATSKARSPESPAMTAVVAAAGALDAAPSVAAPLGLPTGPLGEIL